MADIRFLGSLDGVYFGTRNDIIFENNDVKLVSGKDYVRQKIIKVLLTELGSDLAFLNYGTELKRCIFNEIEDPVVQQNIIDTILAALTYIETQETSTEPSERILSVQNIEINTDVKTLTVYVRIIITLQNGENLTITVGS